MKAKTHHYIKQEAKCLIRKLEASGKFSKKHCKTLGWLMVREVDCARVRPWPWRWATRTSVSAADIISGCTIWQNTTQGFDFWNNIFAKLNNGIDINGVKLFD